MVLSICKYENNKITYDYDHVNLLEDEIILILLDSKILVLVDEYLYSCDFVRKKNLRYFFDEKYNLEKTTYLIWNLNQYGYVVNFDNICKILPSNIKYIKLHKCYNNEPKYIPCSITHLFFGIYFNSSIDCLPYSIEYLHMDCEFNKPIDNLPGNLKKLIFAPMCKFNHTLDNLPNFLEYLFLPLMYSKTIDNLPNFLIDININSHYEHPLNNLPNSIEKITFYQLNNNNIIIKSNDIYVPNVPIYYNPDAKIGNNIKIYNIDQILCKLPKNLKYLDLTYSYKLNLLSDYASYKIVDKNIHIKKEFIKKAQPLDNLPDELRVLKFPSNYNLIQIDKIPQNIIKLWLSNTFNQSVDKLLNPNFGTNKPKPSTKLTLLVFGNKFNNTVNYLPDSILYLYFGDDFNKSVDNLPKLLLHLSFGKSFNATVDNLPNELIFIKFGNKFNSTINLLPNSLKELQLDENFSQSLNNLKYGLKSIKFLNQNCNDKFKTYGYNGIVVDKLPITLENIYIKEKQFYTLNSSLDKYNHLIKLY